MRAYEQAHGVRILDYYDNHWYPQESGVAFGNGTDPATNALRLRSTRNLWDPSYVDESWINQATQLIPRMKQVVADNYPGTRTAITEYNWGALDSINGALAQADVLGIFGREGLGLAALWSPPSAGQPGAYAFRMFLNYDGQGAAFGDTSVQAVSTDQDKLSAYAAKRSDGALTLVLVNKTGDDLSSGVTLKNLARSGKAQVYRYSAANLSAITREADVSVIPAPVCATCPPLSVLSTTFPANSITTLVLPGAASTSACSATYQPGSQWPGGFQASVTVRNTGTVTLHGWTAGWTFANGQTIANMWGATYTQTGADVTAHSVSWNATVPPGGTATFGFTGRLPGTANAAPVATCSSG